MNCRVSGGKWRAMGLPVLKGNETEQKTPAASSLDVFGFRLRSFPFNQQTVQATNYEMLRSTGYNKGNVPNHAEWAVPVSQMGQNEYIQGA